MIATTSLQAACSFSAALAFNRVGQSALADLRRECYRRLISLPMAFFGQRRVGELTSRVSTDIAQIEGALIDALPQMCRQAIFLTGGITLIALTSGRLTAVMLGTLPVLIAAAVYFGRRLRRYSRETQDQLAATNTIVEETLQAIASVKAFANEAFELGRYDGANRRVLRAALGAARWRAVFVAFFILALFGGIVIVLWYGATLMQHGQISAGEMTRFILYTTFVAGAMGQAAELFSQVQKTVGATQRVRELLLEPVEPQSSPAAVAADATLPGRLRGDVTFAGVDFRYPSRPEVQVLHQLSLTVRPGERIALVGPSGAGKSTITALLLRFYEPEAGTVTIDGRDARTYPLTWLRGQMAIVPQDVTLFGGTIAENIVYGRAGRQRGRDPGRGGQSQCGRFHSRVSGRLRDHRRRPRRQTFRRPAPADRDRARDPQGPRDSDLGRGHQLARQRERTPSAARARPADAGPHHVHHRSPPGNHPHRG